MIFEHSEKNNLPFEGTVIDFETIGNFTDYKDSRNYQNLSLTIFGYITKDELKIKYVKSEDDINELTKETSKMIQDLERPFFGYNCGFEMGVLYHSCGLEIKFDGELMKEKVPYVK